MQQHPWLEQVRHIDRAGTPSQIAWMDLGLRAMADTLTEHQKVGILLVLSGYVFAVARNAATVADGAQRGLFWWDRGNRLDIERLEVERGGHWRFVEHGPEGVSGFEGRFREVSPRERIVQTFEWDGMPGYVVVNTTTFEDLGDGRTRVVTTSLFFTTEERDGMLSSGMEQGLRESYRALDRLLADLA